jgi:hypothetical protein
MTAASYTLRASSPPARSGLRWTLALLGVCLPVPICAVSGLSLPLPAAVERIAASLVPWSDGIAMSANEALGIGARGSIVADLYEQSEAGSHQARLVKLVGKQARRERTTVILLPGPGAPSLPGTTPTERGRLAPAAPEQGGGSAQPGDGGSAPSAPASPESPAPAPTTPAQPTEPTQPPVTSDPDPVAAVKPVVDEVLAPVTPVVEETKKTVVETIAPVAPIVPVLPGLGK